MTDYLDPQLALQEINDLKLAGQLTPESFNDVISRIDPGNGAGQTTVLYSGGYKSSHGDVSTNKLAKNLAQTDGFRIIDNSNFADVLTDSRAQRAYLEMTVTDDFLKANNISSVADLTDKQVESVMGAHGYYDSKTSPWSAASRSFAASADGSIVTITPDPRATGIFSIDEFPELMKNDNVTHINGIPKSSLTQFIDGDDFSGALAMVNQNSKHQLDTGALRVETVLNSDGTVALDAQGRMVRPFVVFSEEFVSDNKLSNVELPNVYGVLDADGNQYLHFNSSTANSILNSIDNKQGAVGAVILADIIHSAIKLIPEEVGLSEMTFQEKVEFVLTSSNLKVAADIAQDLAKEIAVEAGASLALRMAAGSVGAAIWTVYEASQNVEALRAMADLGLKVDPDNKFYLAVNSSLNALDSITENSHILSFKPDGSTRSEYKQYLEGNIEISLLQQALNDSADLTDQQRIELQSKLDELVHDRDVYEQRYPDAIDTVGDGSGEDYESTSQSEIDQSSGNEVAPNINQPVVEDDFSGYTSEGDFEAYNQDFSPNGEIIIVQPGDTIWGFAESRNIEFDQGAEWAFSDANPHIEDLTNIPVGAEVNIPTAEQLADARQRVENMNNTPDQSVDLADFGDTFVAGAGSVGVDDDLPESLRPVQDGDSGVSSTGQTWQEISDALKENSEAAAQFSNVQSGTNKLLYGEGIDKFVGALEVGSALGLGKDGGYSSGLGLVKGIDKLSNAESGFDYVEGSVQVIDSIANLSGKPTLSNQSLGGNWTIGGSLSILGAIIAIDDGDYAAALSYIAQAYQSYASTAISNGTGNALASAGASTGAAIAGNIILYADAIDKALDGDYAAAAQSAMWAATMKYAGVYGVVLYVVWTILSYDPPPRASFNFSHGDDGNLDIDVWMNKSVKGQEALEGQIWDVAVDENGNIIYDEDGQEVYALRDMTEEELENHEQTHAESIMAQGDVLLATMRDLERSLSDKLPGGKFDTSKLSELRVEWGKGVDYLLRGGQLGENNVTWSIGAAPKVEAPEGATPEEIDRLQSRADFGEVIRVTHDMAFISHMNDSWIVGQKKITDSNGETFTVDVYDPFGSTIVPNVSEAVTLGIWHGGGNVGGSQELVSTTKADFKTSSDYVNRSVNQEFEDVKQTWRQSGLIFSGDGAGLLAMALVTGDVTWAQIEELGLLVDPEDKPFELDLTPEQEKQVDLMRQLLELYGDDLVIADGVEADQLGKGLLKDLTFTPVEDEDLANDIKLLTLRAEDVVYPPDGYFLNQSTGNQGSVNAQFQEAQLRSRIIRELETLNQQNELPELSDINVVIEGDQVSFVSGDEVLFSFAQAPTTLGQNDTFTMLEDRRFYTTADQLLENDLEGTTFLGIGSATNGSVSIDGAGNIEFIPDSDFTGLASFTYSVGLAGDNEVLTAYIYVVNVDDDPEAVNDALTYDEDTVVGLNDLLLNDSEPDGSGLSVNAVSYVSHGSVSVDSSGNYTYTPEPGYTGDVTLVYAVGDGGTKSSVARSVLTFESTENDAPFVVTDVFNGAIEDTTFQFTASNLLANDSDAEGDPISLTNIELVDASQGVLVWNQALDRVTITPTANLNGNVELRYTVSDNHVDSDGLLDPLESTGTATVVFAAVDDPFTTTDHTLSVHESGTVLLTREAILAGISNDDGSANKSDIEVTSVRLASGETGGEVRVLANGDIRFTPLASHGGVVQFEVRLTNGDERIVSTVDVTVVSGNAAPVANTDDFLDAVEDTAYTFNQSQLLGNDTDAEADAFSFFDIRLKDDSQGSVEYNAGTGEITVTPASNVFGNIELEYRIKEDASGLLSTGSVNVNFAATNDTEAITDKALTGAEDTTTIFAKADLLDTLTDVDGDALSIVDVVLSDPTQGTISITGTGDVEFTPALDVNGEVKFTFEVTDGNAVGDPNVIANATINVTADNDAPVIQDDERLDGVEDEDYIFNASDLLGNDTDVDDTLVLESISLVNAGDGTVTYDSATGEIRYTPTANLNGDVLFDYIAKEDRTSGAQQDIGRLRLVLAPENDTQTITNKSFTVSETDTVLIFSRAQLLDAFVDIDGEALSISSASLTNPADGTITVLGSGDVQFTPAAGLIGVDGISGFQFTVTDGVAAVTANAEVTRGTPPLPNQAPQIPVAPAFANGTEEVDYQFNVAVLEAAAIDPDGDAFSLTDIQLRDSTQGALTWDNLTGEVIIVPTQDVFGNVIVDYTLTDSEGNAADYSSTIVFNNVDDVPDLDNQDYRNSAFNVDEDTTNHIFTKSVLLDGKLKDVDDEDLNITAARIVTPAGIAALTLNADQSVSMTTTANYHSDIDNAGFGSGSGNVQFEIDVTDGNTPQTLTMEVRVWPVNDAPTVTNDSDSMDEGTTKVFSGATLLANDTDLEGDAFSIVGIWAVSSGDAKYDPASDEITFNPAKDDFGAHWVDYLVKDDQGAWSVARLDVAITNLDDPVIANDDKLVVVEDSAYTFAASEFTGNDTNLDRETLTIVSIDDTGFAHGTLTLQGDGSVRFDPEADYAGTQTFKYTVQDADGNTSEASVELVVENQNDAPRITVQTQTIAEDTPQIYRFEDLLTNAVDVDNDWMTVAGVRSSYGDVTYNEDLQRIEYTPTAHFNSTLYAQDAVVEYLVVDENGAQTWGEISITVTPVNDEPVAVDDTLAAWSQGPGVYANPFHQNDLMANDEEYDGEVLRILSATNGNQSGTVTLNTTTGAMTYTSAAGFTGVETFSYLLGDGVPASEDTAEVTVNVYENSAPVASDFLTTADEDTVLTFDYANDIAPHVADVDLNNLLGLPEEHKIVAVNNAQNGSVVLNADGTVTFTPDAHFNTPQFVDTKGMAQFDYTVEDIVGNQSTATARVFYNPVDDKPEAVDDTITATIDEDNQAGLDFDPQNFVLNDFDVDDGSTAGGQFTLTGILGASNGTITDNGDGTFNYVPRDDFNGWDSIHYRITDGTGLTDDGIAQVYVNPVNDNPIASDVSGSGNDRDTNTLTGVLNSAYDIDGDNLRISRIVSTGGNVTSASVSGDNIRWTGNEGSGSITYRISDGNGGSVDATAFLNIIHINHVPYVDRITINSNCGDFWGTAYGIDHDNDGQLRVYLESVSGGYGGSRNQFGNFSGSLSSIGGSGGNVTLTFVAKDQFTATRRSFTVFINDDPSCHGDPIIIDMDGDGLELQPYNIFNAAQYDIDGDGQRENIAWVTGGDALLAVDIDGDGVIRQRGEIAFIDYVDGAKTDLEGLRYFDTDGDGLLTSSDEQWSQFGAWVDDGDGVNEEGEFISLDEVGIESINLTSDGEAYAIQDVGRIHGTTKVTWDDGSVTEAGDASLRYSEVDQVNAEPENSFTSEQDENEEKSIFASGPSDESSTSEPDSGITDSSTNQSEKQSAEVIPFPTDDDVNHQLALENQKINSQPHAEDLGKQTNPDSTVVTPEPVDKTEPVVDEIIAV